VDTTVNFFYRHSRIKEYLKVASQRRCN